jgi:tRNA (cmo5U34)-methyltransferase
MKSTVDEIRARFDNDVERFSNLQTGQSATIDAPLALELIAEAAAATTPHARRLLDVGCGAGNYTLKLLQTMPGLDVTLVDLSGPMLDRARQRVGAAGVGTIRVLQQDIRAVELSNDTFDVILAAAVLHHLRTDGEWEDVFAKLFRSLSRGGSLWIFDLVDAEIPALRDGMWRRYAAYLERLKGPAYRDEVLAYVEREDTPKSLVYQLDLLQRTGFGRVEVLHKHTLFAAFGAIK